MKCLKKIRTDRRWGERQAPHDSFVDTGVGVIHRTIDLTMKSRLGWGGFCAVICMHPPVRIVGEGETVIGRIRMEGLGIQTYSCILYIVLFIAH